MNVQRNRYKAFFCACAVAVASLCASCEQLGGGAPVPPGQRTPSYLAVETYSGRILYTGNPNERRPIGMLANVATALVTLDWVNSRDISMGKMLTVPAEACQWPQTNLLRLKPGDRISLRDALHSCVMWDDSACAATLAYACGSTISPRDPEGAFVQQMNQMARAIGMKTTRFKGPSGAIITQSDTHDMAKLGMYAMQKPGFRAICSQRSYVATVNGTRFVTIVNSNNMLSYPSVDGVRAARSGTAGACLLASANRASVKLYSPNTKKEETYPQRLLIVVLGAHSSGSRYKVAALLLRDCWKTWEEWQKTGDYNDAAKFITVPK